MLPSRLASLQRVAAMTMVSRRGIATTVLLRPRSGSCLLFGKATATTTTPPVSLLPTTSDMARRWFSKNKIKNKNKPKGGGNSNSNSNSNSNNSTIKVYTGWWGDAEEIPDLLEENDPAVIQNPEDLASFLKAYSKAVYSDGESDIEVEYDYQIYNSQTKTFEPLTSLDQVKTEQAKKGSVVIYPGNDDVDDYPDIDDGVDDEDYDDDKYVDINMYEMKQWIAILCDKIKDEGWERQGDGIHFKTTKNGSTTVPTKDLIIKLATDNNDKDLQTLLVGKVGALDHIATCLHWDFVWNSQSEEEEEDL